MVVLSGFRMTLARSLFTCSARRIRMSRENACGKRDGFQPVIIKVEENHLGLSSLQDEITKLLNFQAGLEGQLQLPFDHNV
uniref:Uncharacterized protein n=1 Tax=Pelodiscus sinensis TaxID=13735 RepID=K7GB70_PELSI